MLYGSYIAVVVTLVTKSYFYRTEVATVVLDNCITTNKSKDISENDQEYCISCNYAYLEGYVEEDYLTNKATFESILKSMRGHDKDDDELG